jgi:hypothetical protein
MLKTYFINSIRQTKQNRVECLYKEVLYPRKIHYATMEITMQRSKNHFSKSLLFDAYFVLFGKHDTRANVMQVFQQSDLKSAYRDAVRASHPDLNPGMNTELINAKFRKVTAAYELLNDFLAARETTRVTASQFGPSTVYKQATTNASPPPPHRNTNSAKIHREPIRPKNQNHHYYDGLMPTIGLKIGLFLYYSKKVSFEDLTESLVWQRNMRPPIGELAVQWKWLHKHFVSVILGNVETSGQFGERAVKMGLLKETQVNVLLRQQSFMQKPLGHFFIANRILTPQDIKESLAVMNMHNRVFTDERLSREQTLLKHKK